MVISRDEESQLPSFGSRKEAVEFFKNKYGSDFIYEDFDNDWHFYALIIDHESYHKGKKHLSNGQHLSGNLAMDFLKSYQSIQIHNNGDIHIVH